MSGQYYATINGTHRIRSGAIRIPHVGAWQADVTTDDAITANELSGTCVVAVNGLTLTGTFVRALAWQGTTRARLVGGRGGWQKPIPARFYRITPYVRRSLVLADAARDCGEAMAPGDEDAQISPWFVRPAGVASGVLSALALPWRILSDGTTTIAPYPSGAIGSAFDPIVYEANRGVVQIATDTPADWLPRRTFASPRLPPRVFTVDSVIHHLEATRVRSEIWVR